MKNNQFFEETRPEQVPHRKVSISMESLPQLPIDQQFEEWKRQSAFRLKMRKGKSAVDAFNRGDFY